MNKWFCVQLTNECLWTAILYNGKTPIKDLGGSYSGVRSTIIDASRTWGTDNYLLIPSGYENATGLILPDEWKDELGK